MASSMLEAVLGTLTPQLRQELAARLHEPAPAIQTGLTAAAAATLAGLAGRAADSAFLGKILAMARASAAPDLLGNAAAIGSEVPGGPPGDPVARFLSMVFGSNQGQVAAAISQQAGLTAGSGMGLLKATAPRVLGCLSSVDAAALGRMLQAEAPTLQSHLPAGLSGLLGDAGALSAAAPTRDAAAHRSRWLLALATLVVLVLGWLLFRSLEQPKHGAQPADNATSEAASSAANAVSDAASAWMALGEMTRVKLPDGSEIDVPAKGVEVQLVRWLNDPTTRVNETTWFAFDRLLFDTGKATLQSASQEQLGNVAAILKAYPGLKIHIGGYTDNSGDPQQNVQLSQNRADNVMAALTMLGVDPERMDAKGYGQEHPIADNSSEKGRQKNRRISMRVTEKPGTNSGAPPQVTAPPVSAEPGRR
jgi:OmpA-OmpF porin, OOP family